MVGKSEKQDSEKKNDSGKTKLIIAAIIVVVIIAAVALFALGVFGGAESVAVLSIQGGTVQVDTGSGWTQATDGMGLSLGNKVKTLSDGMAALVIYDSTVIMLEPETEITLENLDKEGLKIYQSAGATWNKFSGIVGVDGMTVETPNTVATIRGTEFFITTDSLMVTEGNVDTKISGVSFLVGEFETVVLVDGVPVKREMNAEEKAFAARKISEYVNKMKDVRQAEIEKYRPLLDLAKQNYGFDEEQINTSIAAVDNGEFAVEELDVLAKEKGIDQIIDYPKLRKLTVEIVEANKRIKRLLE